MDLTYKIVRRLLRDHEVGFSRNQNFEAYEDPRVQRARRIFRHLRSVENDLLQIAPGDPEARVELDTVERDEERVVIRLVFANAGGRRVSILSAKHWELLLENDRVTDILRELLERATTETRESIQAIMPANWPD
ncbi:hypothetical protein [Bradymonas sediminis]|uniref:Uncharacterized protein n=1 Tax=Bradymonas sediminis TaxID=1548548 RepID=A0A2Z4FMA5_9DELT|nr:hypothetical protein [Bradymonas sediminis]AWV89808.1 hypothetical protein DN745_10845 [Bradymonas sediminis]TDP76445.1 hypothetical protein DFR33_10274 [Bradymonas sediminis]